MAAIWQNDGAGWHLLVPTGFPNEATLHDLVEQAPHLLLLAGSPRLIVIGREVQLGSGFADLMAIEPNGRLAIIEIKLARNAEARRAIIAQVLAYAAYLWGMDQQTLEQEVLSKHLRSREYESLMHAVESNDQEGSFDAAVCATGIAESLQQGRFRLVFVLDETPEELVRLVSYLQTISNQLVIDLITISVYTVNGSQVLVPQRVEAERQQTDASVSATARSQITGKGFDGAGDFIAAIDTAPPASRALLSQLAQWAVALEREKLVKLITYHTKNGDLTFLPRLVADNAGLVSIYNTKGIASLQFWRSVFERRAPNALAYIEKALMPIKRGNITRDISDELLNALTDAYREAVGRPVIVGQG